MLVAGQRLSHEVPGVWVAARQSAGPGSRLKGTFTRYAEELLGQADTRISLSTAGSLPSPEGSKVRKKLALMMPFFYNHPWSMLNFRQWLVAGPC